MHLEKIMISMNGLKIPVIQRLAKRPPVLLLHVSILVILLGAMVTYSYMK